MIDASGSETVMINIPIIRMTGSDFQYRRIRMRNETGKKTVPNEVRSVVCIPFI
jgi:hypothetical protein